MHTRRYKGKILSLHSMKPWGYLTCVLSHAGKLNTKMVHHLVMEAFIGPRPQGLEARHIDGKPGNARLDNLAYGTHEENDMDKRLHGTDNRGEQHWRAKLTAEQVLEIRELCKTTPVRDIAAMYDLHTDYIYNIKNRHRWSHI